MKVTPLFIAMTAALSLSLPASADPKPRGAKNLDPQQVFDIYLGKTWQWSKGGSYWGSAGTFQAVWDEDPNDQVVSYTDGEWYVTSKGTLCYKTVWQWTGKSEPDEVLNYCWRHVVDPAGQIWRSDHRDPKDFHKLNLDKIVDGNQVRRTYDKYRRAADR